MTPAARIAAAIEVLGRWAAGQEGLDRVLARWGRDNRYAGAKDRQAVADHAYDALRRARSLQWLAGAGDPGPGLEALAPRAVLLAATALAGEDPGALFAGQRHGPGALSAQEQATIGRLQAGGIAALADAPRPVRLDMPDWLLAEGEDVPADAWRALATRAPVYLRANRLRTDRAGAAAALAEAGIETVPGPLTPDCLEIRAGARALAQSAAYRDGLVEIQDAASQAAAAVARLRPGMTVIDLCAGGGGKTLALGAAMGGRGRLIAHDLDPRRMADLPQRAARAGLTVERVESRDLAMFEGRADCVFVDAPCSGSGAWRRNPDARWRLTPRRLAALLEIQDGLIDQANALAAPGGQVVFATCSFLPAEGRARLQALGARSRWRLPPDAPPDALLATLPSVGGPDGFYAVRLSDSSR